MALSRADQCLPSGDRNEKVESRLRILSVQSSELVFCSPPNLSQVFGIGSLSSNEGLRVWQTLESSCRRGPHSRLFVSPSPSLLLIIVEPPRVRWEEQGSCYVSDEKLTISPSLRVRINPLKTSQILAPRSATLGLTTGGNYTFSFLFSWQTAPPPWERTHTLVHAHTCAQARSILCNPGGATIATRPSDDTPESSGEECGEHGRAEAVLK